MIPSSQVIPSSRDISPRRDICLLAFTLEKLSQSAHEQCARNLIAPYRPFCYVDGDLELYTCIVRSITARQGGMSRLFLYMSSFL